MQAVTLSPEQVARVKLRIATRRALGMTPEEFDAHERQLEENLIRAQHEAVNQAIRVGMDRNASSEDIDAALAQCRTLGVTTNNVRDAITITREVKRG